ncbi:MULTISPECIES: CDP-alcohol phosphatidyltransferase family protein [unclassified Arthrobacter]|uniref:CDP-alcohol phosphatidyltransferase family protein n=1 Tax=unclassified Arthrobacter TaxID=235627 RepID=UPI001F2A68D6|nr:CDP-alcohol phosphatidyltransferase family protein [Arthrobacter sp. FW305-BF8]UKA54801.1 CDP-alcohol phosphatidyltransferase family protein [Arthrobacter sp. FW305-BF8]
MDVAVAMAAFLVSGSWILTAAGAEVTYFLAAMSAGLAVVGNAAASVLSRKPLLTTAADRVTLTRAVLISCCAAIAVPALLGGSGPGVAVVVLGAAAFLLDAVDGAVARRFACESPAGGRLDVQTDAALVLVLSCAAVPIVGPWVLAVGLMWYAFVAAGWFRPELKRTLPVKRLRKVIGAYQPCALLLALTPGLPGGITAAAVVLALVALLASFGRDVVELEQGYRKWTGRHSSTELVN